MVYSTQVKGGTYASKVFSYNFGVNTSQFGEPVSGGQCLLGLTALDLYFYRATSFTSSTSFLFTFNGSQVLDISHSYTYEIRMQVLCSGYSKQCPNSYMDSITNQCQVCRYDCLTCLSASTCHTCNPSAFR
jgi:hypothetical protein